MEIQILYLPALVILHILNAASFWISLYSLINTSIFSVVLSLVYIKILFIKFRQIYSIIPKMTHLQHGSDSLKLFKVHYIQTLGCFFKGRALFSDLFLSILCLHCPENVWLIMHLIHGGYIPLANRVLVSAVVFYEMLAIFAVHLFYAFTTDVIHKPGTQLHRASARCQKSKFSLLSRLQLNHVVASIHTRNRYGFTYGPFGLVSLAAFSKVSIYQMFWSVLNWIIIFWNIFNSIFYFMANF